MNMMDYIYDLPDEDEPPEGIDPMFDFAPEPLGWGENGSAEFDKNMIKS